jgi:hypothetical protein
VGELWHGIANLGSIGLARSPGVMDRELPTQSHWRRRTTMIERYVVRREASLSLSLQVEEITILAVAGGVPSSETDACAELELGTHDARRPDENARPGSALACYETRRNDFSSRFSSRASGICRVDQNEYGSLRPISWSSHVVMNRPWLTATMLSTDPKSSFS